MVELIVSKVEADLTLTPEKSPEFKLSKVGPSDGFFDDVVDSVTKVSVFKKIRNSIKTLFYYLIGPVCFVTIIVWFLIEAYTY